MDIRQTICTIFAVVLILNTCDAVIQVDVSQISLNFGSTIKSFLPSCNGVDLDFYLQISTSNYSSQSVYFIQQQDAQSYSIDLGNSSSFQIKSPTDFISLSGILAMRCSISPSPFSDSFLLQSQSSKQPDGNMQSVPIQVTSNINQWTLTATIIRKCTGVDEYGFNCNEQCSTVNDAYYCYTCGNYGQKTCCVTSDVNQADCSYYNHPASTTWSPNTQCSASAENTYFWLMISFAIIIAILAILLLLVLLELCCGLFTGHRAAKGSEDGDWIVQREPKANRELYDADINRHHQYRRRQEDSRENSADQDENRRSPYVVSRQGLDNQTYDDESLQNQWVEPQPRRVARV